MAAKLLILRCVHHPSALIAVLVAATGCLALEPSDRHRDPPADRDRLHARRSRPPVRARGLGGQLRFASLRLAGTAGMDDSNQDGVGEGFFGGAWAAELDAGAGAIMMTAPFD